MEEMITCPTCHVSVKPTDYFCYNCGKNLHPQALSTSAITQISIYLGSIFLPPMGIVWGIRYLRQSGSPSKIVGWIAIILTIAVLVISTYYVINLMNTINDQVNKQLQNVQAF